jgi:hypothetical protein
MRLKIIINTFVDTRTKEEIKDPFYVKGHNEMVQVWSGDLDIKEDNVYLTKVSMIAEGIAHPICDIPFAIGLGHYLWIPPDIAEEEQEDGDEISSGRVLERTRANGPLFRDIGKSSLPRMRVEGRRRTPREWISYHIIQRLKRTTRHTDSTR